LIRDLLRKDRKEFIRIDEIPFDSDRKIMTTINTNGNDKYAFSKGAPEILLKSCSYYIQGVEVRPIEEIIDDVLEKMKGWLNQA